MAASLLAMNAVFGRFFGVLPIEAAEAAAFQERSGAPFFIFDVQLHLGEPPGLAADPAFAQLATLAEDADLAVLLVQVDANIVHDWPPPRAPVSACSLSGALYATTSSWGAAASSDLCAMRFPWRAPTTWSPR
jgi:hypothetical protein